MIDLLIIKDHHMPGRLLIKTKLETVRLSMASRYKIQAEWEMQRE